jgi:hypothetical protein
MKSLICASAGIVLAIALASPASAGAYYVSSGNGINYLGNGPGVANVQTGNDSPGNNNQAMLWFEREVTLSSALSVDEDPRGWAGTGQWRSPNPSGSPDPTGSVAMNGGRLAAGVTVESYYLMWNPFDAGRVVTIPATQPGGATTVLTITFSKRIVGIIATKSRLDSTDATFQYPGTTFTTNAYRGINDPSSVQSDAVLLDSTRTVLTIHRWNTADNYDDSIRILVNPEPSTLVLFGAAAAGLFAVSRRRARRRSMRTAR